MYIYSVVLLDLRETNPPLNIILEEEVNNPSTGTQEVIPVVSPPVSRNKKRKISSKKFPEPVPCGIGKCKVGKFGFVLVNTHKVGTKQQLSQ